MARVTRKVPLFQMFERLMERSQVMDGKMNILMKEVGRLRGVIQKEQGAPVEEESDVDEEHIQVPLEEPVTLQKKTTTDWGLWQSNWAVKNPQVSRDENFATKMSEAWKQWKESHPGQTYRGFRGSDELLPRPNQGKTRRKVKTQFPPIKRHTPPARNPAPLPLKAKSASPERPAEYLPRALSSPKNGTQPPVAPPSSLKAKSASPERAAEYLPRALSSPKNGMQPPVAPPSSLKTKSKTPQVSRLAIEKPGLPSREVMNSSIIGKVTPAIIGSPGGNEGQGEMTVGEYHSPFAEPVEEEEAGEEEEAAAEEEEAAAEEEEAAAEEEEAAAEEEEAAAEEEEAAVEEEEAAVEEEEAAVEEEEAAVNRNLNVKSKNNSKKSSNTKKSSSPTPLGWDDEENFGEINSQNKTPKSP